MARDHRAKAPIPGKDCRCGKRSYKGRKFASLVVSKIRREQGLDAVAYHCEAGHAWHVRVRHASEATA